jgi:hypothetical protein
MKRWLRISLWAVAGPTEFAIITLRCLRLVVARPVADVSENRRPMVFSNRAIPYSESGRKPKYLVRGGMFLRKAVAEDTTDFQYLGPLCQ